MTHYVNFATTVFMLFSTGTAGAQLSTSIHYDFERAEIPTELRPSGWSAFSGGTRTIEDGSYVIAAPSDGGAASIVEFDPDNVIIESQVRFLDVQTSRVDFASLFVRDLSGDFGGAEGLAGLTGYGASVDTQGELQLRRFTPGVGLDPIVQVTADGFDAVSQDLKLRLVVDGPNVELFAWPATEAMPLSPALILDDPNPWLEGDYVSLGNTTFDPAGVPGARVAFRYLDVTVIPEPTGAALMLAGIALLAKRRPRTPPVRSARSSIGPVVTIVLHLTRKW